MPEGLEIYILSKALQDLGIRVEAYGKHLMVVDPYSGEKIDYTFGLAGKLHISDHNLTLTKINHPTIVSGSKEILSTFTEVKEKLGLHWVTASKEQVDQTVRGWLSRKRQVGALLVDQKEICGIGVAWASEILFRAGVSPVLKSNLLDYLDLRGKLVDSICEVRDTILPIYMKSIPQNSKKFINEWYDNLYHIRTPHLQVYKKGQIVRVSGREFWVSNL
jgi:formamidopyrimidine-DNA glycosylase